MRREDDGKWWICGVRPGGIAAAGDTPEEAYLRFRESYRNVLFDLAEESEKYEDFRNAVDSFYGQIDETEETCWTLALKAIRSGDIPKEGFVSKLPRLAPEMRPTQCTVLRLDKQARYQATDNVQELLEFPVAA
jgi:predicted RNase H-like HicB family nuclease